MRQSNNSNGLNFCSVLAIVFIALKLTGVIDWSWLWVLSPFWIEFILTVVLLTIIELKDCKHKIKYKRSDRIKW